MDLDLPLNFIQNKIEDARSYDMTAWAKSSNAYILGYTFTMGGCALRMLQTNDVAACSERGGFCIILS